MGKSTNQFTQDIAWVSSLLPAHYRLSESTHKGSIHCESQTGINDEESWEYIWKAIQQHFAERFLEIDHITNTNHIKFTIYLK